MRINCEILDLQAFLAVLDHGNFHKAAESLNMSQPAISRRVKALELAFGATLLARTTRHVEPTSIGRALDPMFRRLLCEFENCVFSLADFGTRHPGEITIASVPTAAAYFLPHVLKKFNTQHPDVRFRIVDLSAEEGLECVARGEAEFGINFLGAARSELTFTPLIEDNFVVACRMDHPFAAQKSIRWSDLGGHSLIISQKSGNRALIDQALARSNLRLDWSFEVVHLSTSFGLVEAGVGMSIVPRLARPLDKHPSIAVVPVRDPVVRRTVGIVERRAGRISHAANAFRQLLVQEAGFLDEQYTLRHHPSTSIAKRRLAKRTTS
jgi:DNA-binding transcriptional LysR family regulator